jgi:hypothetical protein
MLNLKLPVVPGTVIPGLTTCLMMGAMDLQGQQRASAELPLEPTPAVGTHRVVPAPGPIRVDGSLDDAGWDDAAVIRLDYEAFPGDNVRPPVETECKVTYDQAHLYLGCVARDPNPSLIRANFTDRDRALADDHIVFLVDPFGDRRRALQFRVNPLGIQMDALFTQDNEDFSWDAIWNSAGRITEDGYVVEVALPFKSLRFPRGADVQSWGLMIERSYPRVSRHRIRSVPTARGEPCLLCQVGRLEGLHGIAPGRDVELSPTLTASRTDRLGAQPGSGLVPGAAGAEPGLSVRWGLTPNVSLSGTVNPDFSQVEADVAQLTVNQRFAILYPEKRPFFLDGADIFQTWLNTVATRKVVDPVAGVKISAKEGPHAAGAFLTHDRVNTLLFPANQQSTSALLDQEVTTGVARYSMDLGQSSTVGGLLAVRGGGEYRNDLGSVDGLLRVSPTLTFRSQLILSRTRYPLEVAQRYGQPEEPFTGFAAITQLSHNSRHWNVLGQFQEISADLRADAGHLPRVDARVLRTNIQRVFWGGDDSPFDRIHVNLLAERVTTIAGDLSDQGATLSVNYQGPHQSQVNFGRSMFRRAYGGALFDLTTHDFASEIRPGGMFTLRLAGRFGDEIDFANSRAAHLLQLQPGLDLRPTRHLDVGLAYTMQRLAMPDDGQAILSADLVQTRLVYNFTARAFVRGLVQYQDVRRDPELYGSVVKPEERRFANQLLFSYKVNPQTVLFLGYADSLLGEREFDLRREDRTFFMKVGYAWRL